MDFGEQREQAVDDRPAMLDGKEVRRVWLVKPAGELPLDSTIDLFIEPGLVTADSPKHNSAPCRGFYSPALRRVSTAWVRPQ